MQGIKIVAIVAGCIGVCVGLYFLLRSQSNILESSEEQVPLEEQKKIKPGQALKLALKSPASKALKLAYQNTEEWDIIRDMDGRISKVVIHRRVMENG